MKHPLDLHQGHRRRFAARRAPRFGRRSMLGDLAIMALVGVAGGLAWTWLPAITAPEGTLMPDSVGDVSAARTGNAPAIRVSFGFCHSGGGTHCVVDGDTFWMSGEKIRIADIDTPETHPPRCPREAELGAAATRRLHALLNGGAVELEPIGRDTDRYGRKLRIVTVDGVGVGETLVAEGLARRYGGGRRAGWCD
jgi:endonuclease YncB( thermonuclease family)